jgi:hypothetical protein
LADRSFALRPRSTAFLGDGQEGFMLRRSRRGFLRRRIVLIASLLALTSVAAASADDWKERPYSPPVGSRWIVEAQTDETEDRPDGVRTTLVKSRSELTIEAKIATGFRVSYVTRDISIDGTAPAVAIMKPVLPVLKDVVVHATIDDGGKPMSVENIGEMRALMQAFVDQTFKTFEEKPRVVAAIKPIFDGMLNAEGADAAKVHLQELSTLSAGQNTGLKPGETRQEANETPSPLGGTPIKMAITIRISDADPKSGNVTYVRDSQMDPAGLRSFLLDLLPKLGAAADKPLPPQMDAIVKAMKLSIDAHAELRVEGGMTRMMREEQTTVVSAMGSTLTKKAIETITVTPAP